MTKSGREIMEISEAFDLTGTAWSAAQLAGCDAKTVARYAAVRDADGDPLARTVRPRLIDGFMGKVEELPRPPGSAAPAPTSLEEDLDGPFWPLAGLCHMFPTLSTDRSPRVMSQGIRDMIRTARRAGDAVSSDAASPA